MLEGGWVTWTLNFMVASEGAFNWQHVQEIPIPQLLEYSEKLEIIIEKARKH